MKDQAQQDLRAHSMRGHPSGKVSSKRQAGDSGEMRADMDDASTSYTESVAGPVVHALRKTYPLGTMAAAGDSASLKSLQTGPPED